MGKWEDLPADLVRCIEENLVLYADKVRFLSICKHWQQSIEVKLPNKCTIPWLLLPCDEVGGASYELFNVLNHKSYYLDLPNITGGKTFIGSSHGWLFSFGGTPPIRLINPFTGVELQLPPRTEFPDFKDADNDDFHDTWDANGHLLCKLILSACPTVSSDCLVVAIYGEFNQLAYCKPGDATWTGLFPEETLFEDVVFCKGHLHALRHGGEVLTIDIDPCPRKAKIAHKTGSGIIGDPLYLVDSSIGLLLVSRDINLFDASDPRIEYSYNVQSFKVYKLDGDSKSWHRLTDIGDNALFLGLNESISISTSNFPGLRRNNIYFTDDFLQCHFEGIQGGTEIGVLDLGSKSFKSLPGFKCKKGFYWPVPVWLTPSTL